MVKSKNNEWVTIKSLHFLDYNPNHMEDAEFKLLCESIKGFTDSFKGWNIKKGYRLPIKIIVNDFNNTIIDGNHRAKALIELGQDAIHKDDITHLWLENKQKEEAFVLAIRNISGEFDDLKLRDVLVDIDKELQELAGFMADDVEMIKRIALSELDGSDFDAGDEWLGMPEYESENLSGITISLHFNNREDVESFSKLIGQSITEKTKYLWYPAQERENKMNKRYVSES
jgi:hypothetical protein